MEFHSKQKSSLNISYRFLIKNDCLTIYLYFYYYSYWYFTLMIEQLPPSPVGGTAGTGIGTPSQDSLPPASISPLLASY